MGTQQKSSGEILIATNPSAKTHYFIHEVVEAGLVLKGTEAKSLRTQAPNLRDAFVEIRPYRQGFEAWLVNTHVGHYSHGNIWNHDPLRRRKLLLHHHQLEKLYGAVIQKGMSLIPLRMYFKKGLAKLEVGLGKGKRNFDKRESLKKKAVERDLEADRKP